MPKGNLQNVGDLLKNDLIDHDQQENISRVLEKFSLEVTPHVLNTISSADKDGAIAAQFIPNALELNEQPNELDDPIGDSGHSPVPGIIHRYKDRVLLNVIQTCAVYCRFCFRRENVGPGNAGLTPAQIDDALEYVKSHTDIWEVILSGGDPLMLSPRRLASLIKRISSIPHVGIIRLHTRVPCVAPDKITESLIAALKEHNAVYMVIHTNHANEITPEVSDKLRLLADAGIPLLSQSVLLKNVNDNAKTLTSLFRKLLENRVKPYYLHHGDLAKGTSHFRTTVQEGQNIMQELRGPVSGLCQPHYVLDLPGGNGKIPINHQYLHKVAPNCYEIDDVFGGTQTYTESNN